jgi:hypothetical protein
MPQPASAQKPPGFVLLRLTYDAESEEARVALRADPSSAQAIRLDRAEAQFPPQFVQIKRQRRGFWKTKPTDKVEVVCGTQNHSHLHTFEIQPGRIYDFCCRLDTVLPIATVVVQTISGKVLATREFHGQNAVTDGHNQWKSLWEGTYPDVMVRASCRRDFEGCFSGTILVPDDTPKPN